MSTVKYIEMKYIGGIQIQKLKTQSLTEMKPPQRTTNLAQSSAKESGRSCKKIKQEDTNGKKGRINRKRLTNTPNRAYPKLELPREEKEKRQEAKQIIYICFFSSPYHMKKRRAFLKFSFLLLLILEFSRADSDGDLSAMLALKKSLNPPSSLGWSDPDPCKWAHVVCTGSKRVTRIQIGHSGLQGTLSPDLSSLTELERLELQWNNISGPVPSLSGLSSLQVLMLSNNHFESIPKDIFQGLSSLQSFEIDNNPFESWEIPESLRDASALQNFSANSANVSGKLPGFLGPDEFPGLSILHLAFNNLEGELPLGLSGSQIQSLWLNGQKLTGSIDVLQNMTGLREVWLHSNEFSGSLPDFSGLKELETLSLRDNSFTGPVPESLISLESLKAVNLTNNHLQGPFPEFKSSVSVDLENDTNSFCLPSPGACDPRVRSLLLIVSSMDYPLRLAESWKGNDPCTNWIGIACSNGNITVINLEKMGLTGTVSPEFGSIKSLQSIVLGTNNLTGTIPRELTTLPNLKTLDLSSNRLFGKVPAFKSNVIVNTSGNPDIGKDKSSLSPPGSSSTSGAGSGSGIKGGDSNGRRVKSSSFIGIIIGSVLGGLLSIFLIGLLLFCWYKKRQKRFDSGSNTVVVHPRHSGSDNESVKITVAGSSVSVGGISESYTLPGTSEAGDNIQMVEAGNMLISIQVLRSVTNNFKSSFKKAIDPTIDLDEETLASVYTVAELAGHCCAREPYQRPDMGHAVNILSSLVELWKPSDQNPEDIYGIDLDMSLPQALKKWQAYEGRSDVESSSTSSHLPSLDNTQMSIPTRPFGFAESFTSVDGR
ncbi:unnamed protein product [Thlaspi arvense]|uniref:Leucine-rich repeat-containing N-terminal plant-type domain-containing protein n=1 Tax=Thlaspi arvense TaxID=13288 RepID=A0AAU9SGQ0_THLAR|nr:unnamed protein product [Thlaspi arvense]